MTTYPSLQSHGTESSFTDVSTNVYKVRYINEETLNKFYSEIQELSVDLTDDANDNTVISRFIELYNRCFICKERKKSV